MSPNYKPTYCAHRKWKAGVISNGESWPRVFGAEIASSSDFYKLGIIPTFALANPTAGGGGSSTAGAYGIVLVYRTTKFTDGLTGDYVQGNASNIATVTAAANDAITLTKVTTTDTKVDKLDVYAAISVSGIYGTFYRVVKDAANTAGTIIFSVVSSNGALIGAGVTSGTADTAFEVLADDNDYPQAQPINIEVNGRMVSMGGIVKRTVATFTNASSTVTTVETVYDGIEFWFIKKDSDTTGGLDGKGTYLCRYATANTVTLVNVDGTADTYDGTTGDGITSIYPEPNRRYSKLLNPHAFPLDNTNNDYPSAIISAGRMPNTNRVLIMGADWVIAEDYDRLPMSSGLNYISQEYGGSSFFSVVSAQGKLWWLDFNKNKRKILCSDGSSVTPISTQKIQNILNRVTLDSNGDVWRSSFIHGIYLRDEETIRWGLYLDNSTVANFILELDLATGDVRSDPNYYPLRYLDAFTYGSIRGRSYIGQYGWSGGIARLGIDNVQERFRDWVGSSGTVSGTLDVAGQTTTVLTKTGASFVTTGDGLKGIQLLIWRETSAAGAMIADRTYYHCRISANTATALTINYVESMNSVGVVTAVGNLLPETPSGAGWHFRIGVVQSMIGPKWFSGANPDIRGTFRSINVLHKGQDVSSSAAPIVALAFENLDNTPRYAEYVSETQEGEQVEDADKTASSLSMPKTNPVAIHGFALHDNNVSTTDTTGMDVEQIILNFNEALTEGGSK